MCYGKVKHKMLYMNRLICYQIHQDMGKWQRAKRFKKQMRVWFNYNGQNYRIDMFNKGDNLKY